MDDIPYPDTDETNVVHHNGQTVINVEVMSSTTLMASNS